MSLISDSKPNRWFEHPRVQMRLALVVWIVPVLIIAGIVLFHHYYRPFSYEFSAQEFGGTFTPHELVEAIAAHGIAMPRGGGDIESLNKLLKDASLYPEFKGTALTKKGKVLLRNESNLGERDRKKLNRLILEAAFPSQCPMAVASPEHRSVVPVYHNAVDHWWARKSLYKPDFSYHYLPQFTVLFMPFNLLPSPYGSLLWRLVSISLLVGGLWRMVRQQFGGDAARAFLWSTLLVMPLSLGALRNGQANVIFAAFTLHAVACLAPRRWWGAAIFMLLALAVKQLGLVLIVFAAVVYRPLRWRVALGIVALAGLPFLFGRPDYVISQYRDFLEHMPVCAAVIEHRFADLNGIFRTFGLELHALVSKLIRALAGATILGVWWAGARRLADPLRAMWLHALVATYLMLFNPMTEANSYVILAPAIGLWATWALGRRETSRMGWDLACMGFSMGLLPSLFRPWFGNYFALIWYPTMAMFFVGMLIYFRRHAVDPAETPRVRAA